jgi:imidazolonepropionase-like amidohydrolase
VAETVAPPPRRWLLGLLAAGAVLFLGAAFLLVVYPLRDPHPPLRLSPGVLAIQGAKLYPSPDVAPLEGATLLVRDGRIAALGRDVPVPAGARLLPCHGCVVTAGYWNAHVHFTEGKWTFADWKPAATLEAQLQDMLTSRGFTTVVDVGSDLRETLSLRRRVESGELRGPAIYTSGSGLYPPHGIPYYLREQLPFFLRWLLPQPSTPQQAARIVERNIQRGADVLKLFTGAYVARGRVLPMPEPIATAAVAVAHAHHQLVFSHPSDLAGTLVAMHSGVDVLAHAPDSPQGIDRALLETMVRQHMAMVPTLKMFATTVTTKAAYLQPIYQEVRTFHALGGQLLFGTDVGYMTDYSTLDEFSALAACGLNAMDVLRMLTTAPAARFGVSQEKGTLAVGQLADLVVLDADPSQDVTNFARVAATVRLGRVLYLRPE